MTATRTGSRYAVAMLVAIAATQVPHIAGAKLTVDASAYGDAPLHHGPSTMEPSRLRDRRSEARRALRALDTQEMAARLIEAERFGTNALQEFERREATIEREYTRTLVELNHRYTRRLQELNRRFIEQDERLEEEIRKARNDHVLELLAAGIELLGSVGLHMYAASQRESGKDSEPAAEGLHVREGMYKTVIRCESDGAGCETISHQSIYQESHSPDAQYPPQSEALPAHGAREEGATVRKAATKPFDQHHDGRTQIPASEAASNLAKTSGVAIQVNSDEGAWRHAPPKKMEPPTAVMLGLDEFLKEIQCEEATKTCAPVWTDHAGTERVEFQPESEAGKRLYRKLAALGSFGADLSPLGRPKALVETALGKDVITGEMLPRWIAAMGIIPGGKQIGKAKTLRVVFNPTSRRLTKGSMPVVFERYLKGTRSTVTGSGGLTRKVVGNIFNPKTAELKARTMKAMDQLKQSGQTNQRLKLDGASVDQLLKIGQSWVCGGKTCKVAIGTTLDGGVAIIPSKWRLQSKIKRFRVSNKGSGIEGNIEIVDLTNVPRGKSIQPTIREKAQHNLHLEL